MRDRRKGRWTGIAFLGMLLVTTGCAAGSAAPTTPEPVPEEEAPPADTVAVPEPDSVPVEPVEEPVEEPEEVEEEPVEEPVREPAPTPSPVASPDPRWEEMPLLPGAILPRERIVAFYGHAGSRNMGILGELPPDEMLARLDREVRRWEQADPSTPVRPALHVIATMAAGDPGPDSLWRVRMPPTLIDRVMGWAETRDALVFVDIQPGLSDVQSELPRLERWLREPNVHLGLDPEWNMPPGGIPGKQIGTMDASEVNYAIRWLADLVEEHGLPPKVLVVHRFTSHMLTNAEGIELDPRVQLVMHMDGWGPPAQKRNTYRQIVAPEIPQWAGFKLFYKNDTWNGSRMLTPEEILALFPAPIYIQYQ